jgi:muscleblind protein
MLVGGKDSRWLQLEVCREFQRQKCTRSDTECKFAHPKAHIDLQDGKVVACYDSIKVSLSSSQLRSLIIVTFIILLQADFILSSLWRLDRFNSLHANGFRSLFQPHPNCQ